MSEEKTIETEKKPYHTPKLSCIGSVADMTQQNVSNGLDGGNPGNNLT